MSSSIILTGFFYTVFITTPGGFMLQFFDSIDKALFLFLNTKLANPAFDLFFPFITNKYTWIPVWLGLIIFLIWKYKKRGAWAVFLIILAVGSSDMVGHRVLKKGIKRVRPCNALEEVHLTVRRSSGYSMPSNHAANFFAVATLLSMFFVRYRKWFFLIAFLVAYSRIAVGVHYPFDAMMGALLGYAMARIFHFIFSRFKSIELPNG